MFDSPKFIYTGLTYNNTHCSLTCPKALGIVYSLCFAYVQIILLHKKRRKKKINQKCDYYGNVSTLTAEHCMLCQNTPGCTGALDFSVLL